MKHWRNPKKRTNLCQSCHIEGSGRERGNSGKESHATDIGSDGIGHNFLAPGVLKTADALSSMLEAHLLPLKVPMPDLAIESLVCEIRPGDDGLM